MLELVAPLLHGHRIRFCSAASLLDALGRLQRPRVAEIVLEAYPKLAPDVQPRAIELLTQRPAWSRPLLQAIAQRKIPAAALNVNQVRHLLASKDPRRWSGR